MNTMQLECFMAVANFLNFSRAAEHLRITQPAVSHQISSLEDELEAKLFHRTSKSVRLTHEGYLFTQYADEILRLSDRSKTRLKEFRSTQPSYLRLGCRNTMDLQLLRPVLEKLRLENPDLIPVLRLIPSDSLENLLEEGNIQAMFSFKETSPQKAVYRELLRCPMVCVCHKTHPLADCEELTTDLLKQSGRMAVCRPPLVPPTIFSLQGKISAEQASDQLIFCDNLEILYTLVSSGFAFAVIADFPQLRLPELRYIPLREIPPISFGISYKSGERSPVLRRFLALLSETPGNESDR